MYGGDVVRLGAGGDEQAGRFEVTFARGKHQRREAVLRAGLDVGAMLDQDARDAGVAGRVSFEVADATRFPGTGYDLVTFTDCLHDLGDPVAAAAHARSALAPGGTVMVVEPLAADRLEDDFTNPYARIGYAISTLVCTPSSLAQPGAAALGAMAGETRLRQVLAEAGYTRVRRVAQEAAPFNIVLEAGL